MDVEYSFSPLLETLERKREAISLYKKHFGVDVPECDNEDARYMAAVLALSSEVKTTAERVADIKAFLKTFPKRPHAD